MSSSIWWKRGVTAAIFLTVVLSLTTHLSAQFPGTPPTHWSKAAPLPESEEELYGVTANGKMYVIGGYGVNGDPVGMLWEYDPTGDKWTKKKSMPVRAHHAALAEYHGKIYVFGGFTLYQGGGWAPIDNVWEYDPANDTWKALAPMLGKRGSPVAAQVNGKIYVIGGAIPEPGSKEVAVFPNKAARSVGTNEAYDPATNKWETRSSMPTPRNHTHVGVVNGKIYVIGGRITSAFITVASNLDVVEEYDPASNTWGGSGAREPMPTARSGGGWATYNGKIYIAGGEIQTRQMLAAFRALEAYDPATNTWAILPSIPLPRHGVATAVLGNKIHFVSGKITSGGYNDPGVTVTTGSHDVLEIPDK